MPDGVLHEEDHLSKMFLLTGAYRWAAMVSVSSCGSSRQLRTCTTSYVQRDMYNVQHGHPTYRAGPAATRHVETKLNQN